MTRHFAPEFAASQWTCRCPGDPSDRDGRRRV